MAGTQTSWWRLALLVAMIGLAVRVAPAQAEPPSPFPEGTDPYWLKARETVYRKVIDLLVHHRGELARGLRFTTFLRGNASRREIALTFDDGPHPDYTPRLLEILRKYHANATFFVVGEQAERHPELIREMVADGNAVANHTYHHVNLNRIPEKIRDQMVATEIKACGEVLAGITGKPPHLFRPPGGDYTDRVLEVCEALGYKVILWTDNPGDYRSPSPEFLREYVLDSARNGGIILLHDGVEQTVEVLPQILEILQARGFKLVSVDQLMADQGQARASGPSRAGHPRSQARKNSEGPRR